MKKLISLMLCALLCLALLPATAETVEPTVSGDYEYVVLEDGTAEIAKYTGAADALDIPAELDGLPVTAIGRRAFSSCDSLTAVTIPEGVTSIGEKAFVYCTALTGVTIPEGVTAIGNEAFSGCESLAEIAIPGSVTEVGVNPFTSCSALASITVPADHPALEIIDGALFGKADHRLICCPAKLPALTFDIPQGTEIIDGSAFSWCMMLKTVAIPDSVKEIGVNPFDGCFLLESIEVSPDNPVFEALGGVLFDKADHRLVCCPPAMSGEIYEIPQGIETIGAYAFSCCNFTGVTIPDSVTAIEDDAFSVSDLTAIAIPDSVTEIGKSAFTRCDGLTEVTIPAGVTVLSNDIFAYCEGLTRVAIPEGVTVIGARAFIDCGNLTEVNIPESVTEIGLAAFNGCAGLTALSIPAGVEKIERLAFDDCENLTLTVSAGSYAEQYCRENELNFVLAEG